MKSHIHDIVSSEVAFYCKDGRQLKSLQDLISHLHHVSYEEFRHHVTNEKNDYANWVKDIFHEPTLALRMLECHTPRELSIVIASELNHTTKKLESHAIHTPHKHTHQPVKDVVNETLQRQAMSELFSEKPHKSEEEQPQTPTSAAHSDRMTESEYVSLFEKKPVDKRLDIHEQIRLLHDEVKHLTSANSTPHYDPKEPIAQLKDRMIDFVFGFIIGLLIGIIIVKSASIL